VTVTACDLWIDPHAVEELFRGAGLAESITAVQADVRQLPFPDDALDAIVSIDASNTSERIFHTSRCCFASSSRAGRSA
jgi:cyclopropane fatty-acyl-phospholipid synthase-like methyltransferase